MIKKFLLVFGLILGLAMLLVINEVYQTNAYVNREREINKFFDVKCFRSGHELQNNKWYYSAWNNFFKNRRTHIYEYPLLKWFVRTDIASKREMATDRCINYENKIESFINENSACVQVGDCAHVPFGPCGSYTNKNMIGSLPSMLIEYYSMCDPSIIAMCMQGLLQCLNGKCVYVINERKVGEY